ncbi:MAG: hypothetical protein JWR61_227 [Ferruginibacter sp.]|nr:hypothetical protein [Ferruginibacter sp.]
MLTTLWITVRFMWITQDECNFSKFYWKWHTKISGGCITLNNKTDHINKEARPLIFQTILIGRSYLEVSKPDFLLSELRKSIQNHRIKNKQTMRVKHAGESVCRQ